MSQFKVAKMDSNEISSKMMLLHLRWQQIRLELLQQAALNAQPEMDSHIDGSTEENENLAA